MAIVSDFWFDDHRCDGSFNKNPKKKSRSCRNGFHGIYGFENDALFCDFVTDIKRHFGIFWITKTELFYDFLCIFSNRNCINSTNIKQKIKI